MTWYFQDGDRTVGPLDDNEFHELVSRGRVSADTLVQREGETEWMPHKEALRASKIARYKSELDAAQVDLTSRASAVEGVRWVPGMTGGALRFGSFGARFLAKLIDVLFQALIISIFVGMLFVFILSLGENPNPMIVLPVVLVGYVLVAAFPIVYNAEFVARRGATPGKAAMGLKVVDADGKAVSRGRAWGRAFAELLSGMTFYIGYLLVLFDNEKRSLHDLVCDTRVIQNL